MESANKSDSLLNTIKKVLEEENTSWTKHVND